MPTIVDPKKGGKTDMSAGTITPDDILTMEQDYLHNLNLVRETPFGSPPKKEAKQPKAAVVNRAVGSKDVSKKSKFYFTRTQILELFDSNPKANSIEIAICVQLPESAVHCSKMKTPKTFDVSNDLSVIVSMANAKQTPTGNKMTAFNRVGDQVLMIGYSDIVPTPVPPSPANVKGGTVNKKGGVLTPAGNLTITKSADCCPGST